MLSLYCLRFRRLKSSSDPVTLQTESANIVNCVQRPRSCGEKRISDSASTGLKVFISVLKMANSSEFEMPFKNI